MKDNLKKNLAQLQHEISVAKKHIEVIKNNIKNVKIEIENDNALDSYRIKGLAKEAEKDLENLKSELSKAKKFIAEKEQEAAQVSKKMEAAQKEYVSPHADDKQKAVLIGMVLDYKNKEITAKEFADGYNKLDKNGKDFLIERLSKYEDTLHKFKEEVNDLAKQGKGFVAKLKNQDTYKEINDHVHGNKGQSRG
jgi:hypothetical protein